MPSHSISQALEQVVESASATAIQLSAIGVEMRAVLVEDRHNASLSAQVLSAHAKRAALALCSLSAFIGQIEALSRIEAE